jgi:hypothetical protein
MGGRGVLVPLIELSGHDILGDGGLSLVEQIERSRLLAGKFGGSRGTVEGHRSVQYCEGSLRVAHLESNVAGRLELELLLAEQEGELIASCLQQAYIGRSLYQAHRRGGCTRRKTIQFRELHDRIRCDSQGAVVFELDLSDPRACLQPAVFDNRKVRHDGLIPASSVAIQPYRAIHLAEAHDAHLRNFRGRPGFIGGLCGKSAEKQQERDAR